MFKIKKTNKVDNLHGKWIDDGTENLYVLNYIGDGCYEVYDENYEMYNERVTYEELMEGVNRSVFPYKILDKHPRE